MWRCRDRFVLRGSGVQDMRASETGGWNAMRGSVRIVVVAMAVAVVAAACSSSSSGSNSGSAAPGTQGGTFSVANCEPATSLIPSNNYEGCGTQVFEVL